MTVLDTDERVVLVDDAGTAIGTAPKSTVHHTDTQLHLAFSCYIFDADDRVLVTRRALTKQAWPGVWTNSCCGHPAPGESLPDAVARRVGQELGLTIDPPVCALPEFRYRATAADGIVENEICPVFVARTSDTVAPNPAEVMEWRWVPWPELATLAASDWAISPWAALQVPLLAAAGVPFDNPPV